MKNIHKSLLEEGEGMVDVFEFIERPDVLLVEFDNGHVAVLGHVNEDGVELGGVCVFLLTLVLVFHVDLLLGEIDVAFLAVDSDHSQDLSLSDFHGAVDSSPHAGGVFVDGHHSNLSTSFSTLLLYSSRAT